MAEAAAEGVIAHIEQFGKGVASITPAGSLRRGKETVGDLDLLLTLADGFTAQKHIDSIAEHILKYPRIDQVLAHGENKVSFTLDNGIQVDVRLLDKDSFGAALLYFTGSREHNVTLRGRANDIGYTLNEYALATLKGERRVAGRTEEEIYAKLKLDFIPPEIRENTGEIEAAEQHRLPNLVRREDIKGDLAKAGARIHRHHGSLQVRDDRQRPGRKTHGRAHQKIARGKRERLGDSRSGRRGS